MPLVSTPTHKFDENIIISLKTADSDEQTCAVFQMVAKEFEKEGSHYSIHRESFVRFFNGLNGGQQKEFPGMISSHQGNGKNLYDIAEEFNLKMMNKKP